MAPDNIPLPRSTGVYTLELNGCNCLNKYKSKKRLSHRAAIGLTFASLPGLVACTQDEIRIEVTIADARQHPAQYVDTGTPGDTVGDILTFDQPLLDEQMNAIGNNSGVCVRTRIEHSFQCQWTLTFDNGSIQVAGREFDQGTSTLSIVGGSGAYAGIVGEMVSTNNNDGTFTQILRYRIR